MVRTTLELWAQHLNMDMFPSLTDEPMRRELVRFGLAVITDENLQKELTDHVKDGKLIWNQ